MEYTWEPTLFLSGDYEAQKLCRTGVKIWPFIRRHFLYSILLSSRVTMPAGCYYQSKDTQNLVFQYEPLFLPYKNAPACSELSIGDDRDSFEEDTKVKGSWFPEGYGYQDEVNLGRLTKRLNNISPAIRSGKMRKRLTRNISGDIDGRSKVKEILAQKLESEERAEELVNPLRTVIEVQKFAILPAYIQSEMERHGLEGEGQKRWLDFILFKNYAQSCEEAYESYCNNPLSIFYDNDFRRIYPFRLDYRDTNLFEHFIKLFPFPRLDKIERMRVGEILKMKESPEFRIYFHGYKKVVQAMKTELQAVLFAEPILDSRQFYGSYEDFALRQHRRERELFRTQIVKNAEEAGILYRALKYPFLRNRRFRTWLSRQNMEEFPTILLLSCVKDKRNGILKSYLHELFQYSVNRYNSGRKSNNAIVIGSGTINQWIDSEGYKKE